MKKLATRLLLYWTVIFVLFLIYFVSILNDKENEIKHLKLQNQAFKSGVLIQLNQIQNEMYKVNKIVNHLKNKRFLTYKDIRSLEKIVEVEAEGEGIKGKVLVASVVLNRWDKSNKSINQILHEPGQFQPVRNGKYYSAKPSKETKKAIELATEKDYSFGARYFMNPEVSSRSSVIWFRNNLQPTVKHRKHQFFR